MVGLALAVSSGDPIGGSHEQQQLLLTTFTTLRQVFASRTPMEWVGRSEQFKEKHALTNSLQRFVFLELGQRDG